MNEQTGGAVAVGSNVRGRGQAPRGPRLLPFLLLFLGTLAGPAGAASPEPNRVALVGGRVLTMAGRTYDPGRVLIEGQSIVAVGGTELDVPPRYRTVDTSGTWVVPGLIDAGTHLGLIEVDLEEQTSDLDDSMDLFTPHLRVVDALNPQSELVRVNRLTGVTTVLVAPAEGNVFSGQAAIVDLDGAAVEEMTVRAAAFLCVNLGTEAVARGKARSRFATRMGLAAEIRGRFIEAGEYRKKWDKYRRLLAKHQDELTRSAAASAVASVPSALTPTAGKVPAAEAAKAEKPEPPDEPARDLKLEVLVQALERKLPVLVRAHREDDIRSAIRLADEFKLKLVLNHGSEAWKAAELLAKKEVPVVVGPINQQPDSFETLAARYDNAELLRRAGVRIAIQSSETHNVRNLPYAAGLAAAHGLPPQEALEAVTAGAARVLGIADRYGTLEKGKIANIAVTEGDPLQPQSKLRKLYIRGRELPLTSRQTELYDKFKGR